MVRTDQAYINQYLVYDEVFEACEACEKACVEADYFLRKEARKSYLDTYFSEALNVGAKKNDKTEDNIFAKIGKAIVTLIEKIKKGIKHITDAILGSERRNAKTNSAVQKIIAENPELKKDIIKGVRNEWFTSYDVAGYKNDIIGLINMIDQAKIDNATAMDKFKMSTEKFRKGTVKVIAGAGAATALFKFVTELNNQRKALRDMATDVQKLCEKKKEEAEKKGKDAGVISNVLRIITSTIQVLFGIDKQLEDNTRNIENHVESATGANKS